jgi:hypothetical protein
MKYDVEYQCFACLSKTLQETCNRTGVLELKRESGRGLVDERNAIVEGKGGVL